MNVQDIIPTIEVDFGSGESTRSYLYSPHLLYSPHVLYPGGVMYGIYPTPTGISDILPVGDNKDIRP